MYISYVIYVHSNNILVFKLNSVGLRFTGIRLESFDANIIESILIKKP